MAKAQQAHQQFRRLLCSTTLTEAVYAQEKRRMAPFFCFKASHGSGVEVRVKARFETLKKVAFAIYLVLDRLCYTNVCVVYTNVCVAFLLDRRRRTVWEAFIYVSFVKCNASCPYP